MNALLKTSILAAGICLLFNSCKKGDVGPAGPTGNANVTTYTFTPPAFTGSLNLVLTGISQGKIDSSLVLVYFNPATEAATAWYPCPGFGSSAIYNTRYFLYQTATAPSTYTLSIRTLTPAGAPYSSAVTFTKVRVIFATSTSMLTGGRVAQPVDFTDYYAVLRYYHIQE